MVQAQKQCFESENTKKIQKTLDFNQRLAELNNNVKDYQSQIEEEKVLRAQKIARGELVIDPMEEQTKEGAGTSAKASGIHCGRHAGVGPHVSG